jgi:predicted enzyme related to lactoylglutathione lyase
MKPWTTGEGITIFSPFDEGTDYFPEDHAFMLNFRVESLDAALKGLADAGIESGEVASMDGVGMFARIHDPEVNPIELWEASKA